MRLRSVIATVHFFIESLHSLHRKIDAMSKTQADVQAALDDLSTTTSTALTDIATEVTNLQAQITALQGQTSPDLSPLLDSIAAIKSKITAADPGAPAAAPTP